MVRLNWWHVTINLSSTIGLTLTCSPLGCISVIVKISNIWSPRQTDLGVTGVRHIRRRVLPRNSSFPETTQRHWRHDDADVSDVDAGHEASKTSIAEPCRPNVEVYLQRTSLPCASNNFSILETFPIKFNVSRLWKKELLCLLFKIRLILGSLLKPEPRFLLHQQWCVFLP